MAKKKYTAATADKYELYIKSVQNVETEIDFVCERFQELSGRALRILREDFCGAFAAAAEFVNRSAQNIAYALDLDAEVLRWGRQHVLPNVFPQHRKNLHLQQRDVLTVSEPVDAVIAMNFSYFIFKQREQLRRYFQIAAQSLKDDGVFFMDCYGGMEAQKVTRDKRRLNGFTYIWDQAVYNPITNETQTYIHFYFPDRTRIMRAFSYDWRLWTLREITEILHEAKFRKTTVYWEEWDDKKNEGTGVFLPVKNAENCEAWVAYIVAQK